jgi:hypothetical protein
MRIFFDVFTDDELFNDSYPMKVVDNLCYEVEGKVRRFWRNIKLFHEQFFRISSKATILMINSSLVM